MTHLPLMVFIGSIVLLLFAVSYIAVLLTSHRKVMEAQKAKISEVQQSEQRYRELFEHSLAGMLKFDVHTWQILAANDTLRSMFGCSTAGDLQDCFTRMPLMARQHIQEVLKQNGIITGYEIQTHQRDGAGLWLLFSAKLVESEGYAHSVIIDITKRKRYEETIEEQSALLNETQDAIMTTDDQGRLLFWNTGAFLTYGWNSPEVLGRLVSELLYRNSNRKDYELAMEDIQQFREWSGEHRQVTRAGKEILVRGRWKLLINRNSDDKVLLMINSDITQQKRMEAQFVRAQRMESIALLTGGIAHDLHNILAPVAISMGLLREKLSDESDLAVLQAAEESTKSGLELVKNILTFGHGVVNDRTMIVLPPLLEQVLHMLESHLPETIYLQRVINDQCWLIEGDATQLKQAFLNLVVNARDAMPHGGTLKLELSNVELTNDIMDIYPEAKPGAYAVFSISDTGVGIPPDQQDKIFEPFFTTKQGSEGTGLGLSIALGIIKSHDGFITVESKVGQGSTFKIYLPAVGSTQSY